MDNIEITHSPGEGLRHDFRVRVSASDLDGRLQRRISEIRPQMNLRGFRPGKVPAAHIRRLYGKSLMEEILGEVMRETGGKACEDAGFRPALEPEVNLLCEPESVFGGESDFEYEMQIEAIPEFAVMDVTKLELQHSVAEPDAEALQGQLERLAEGNASYHKSEGREALDGDAVLLDFTGRVAGEIFEGGSAEGQRLVLGSGSFVPGFEAGLIGCRSGDEREIPVTFPEDYGSEELRGKTAVFSVVVKEVQQPQIPSIDDDLAKSLGLEGGLGKLRDVLRSRLQAEYGRRSRALLKHRLFDFLEEGHDFLLPQGMVEAEFEDIWRHGEKEREVASLEKTEDQWRQEYRKIAERRVRLGLIMAKIGEDAGIEVKSAELDRAIMSEASRHPGREKEAAEFLRKDKGSQARLRAPLFEEKVVDYIMGRAQMSEQVVSLEELASLEAGMQAGA